MRVVPVLLVAAALVAAGCVGDGGSAPLVGRPAPVFTVEPVDEPPWSLSDQQGRVVLLEFMGVHCVTCHRQMPHLIELAGRHAHDTGFAMLSIDTGALFPGLGARSTEELREYKREWNATWPFAPDTGGHVGRAYQPITLSTIVIVAPDGTIAAKFSGGEPDADTLDEAVRRARGA